MVEDYIKLRDIKPALTRYIGRSQELMKQFPFPDDEAIHDVRVFMKRSRSVLKMIGPHLNTDLFNKDIDSLKLAGQIMSNWRDTSVLRRIIKEIKKESPDLFVRIKDNDLIAGLSGKIISPEMPDGEMKKNIDEISDLLNNTAYRVRFHTMSGINPVKLLEEMEKSFLAASAAYLDCRNNPKAEKLHKFRKKTKDFLYQLWFFRPVNPDKIKSIEKKLEEMTIYLGRYNDLVQLINYLGYKYPESSGNPAMDELLLVLRDKQDKALAKVWPVAFKIFCPGQKLTSVLGFKKLLL